MKILVTGAAGMIGSYLTRALVASGYEVVGVDRKECEPLTGLTSVVADLGNAEKLKQIVSENQVDRVIHLAALAHTAGEDDLSYEKYYQVNVECAINVFRAAGNCPVLFISTVDVYGFTKGVVSAETELHPVTPYGKTKALAEEKCRSICENYSIYRLSPVYTPDVKRDIQKRYYLKYPDWAYVIGGGTEYEVLNIEEAVRRMVEWCGREPQNEICIIKDKNRMNTADYIRREKAEGRAKHVLRFSHWMVACGFAVIKGITGKNKYTYLLNKAVNPLRTE